MKRTGTPFGDVSSSSPECIPERPRVIYSEEALARSIGDVVHVLFQAQISETESIDVMQELFWHLCEVNRRSIFVITIIPVEYTRALDEATVMGLRVDS